MMMNGLPIDITEVQDLPTNYPTYRGVDVHPTYSLPEELHSNDLMDDCQFPLMSRPVLSKPTLQKLTRTEEIRCEVSDDDIFKTEPKKRGLDLLDDWNEIEKLSSSNDFFGPLGGCGGRIIRVPRHKTVQQIAHSINQFFKSENIMCSTDGKKSWDCEYASGLSYVHMRVYIFTSHGIEVEVSRLSGDASLCTACHQALSDFILGDSLRPIQTQSKKRKCSSDSLEIPRLSSDDLEISLKSLSKWMESDPMEAGVAIANVALDQDCSSIQFRLFQCICDSYIDALQQSDRFYCQKTQSYQELMTPLPVIVQCVLFAEMLLSESQLYENQIKCDLPSRLGLINSMLPILAREAICGKSQFIRKRSGDVMERYTAASLL